VKVKKKLCVGCKSEQYIWKNQSGNRYCKTCWYRIKEKVIITKPKPVLSKKITKPIKKVSSKMSVQLTIYTKLRRTFLEKYPLCQASLHNCNLQSTDVHHKKGRGKHLNDPTTWLSVCRSCHNWIEDHPVESTEMGFTNK
jgi:hypothetical protein